MRMLSIAEYIGSIGIGVTSPRLFRADDGFIYVVKLQYNKLGPKVLANELLATKIGEKMNLCFPPGGLIRLEAEVIGKTPKLARAGLVPGNQFACRYLPHSSYVTRHQLAKAINKQQLAGVMLFDHLLHNFDRTWNRKNLLIRRENQGPTVYAIDNSHLFVKGRWTPESLENLAGRISVNHRRSYGILLKHYLQPADFEPYVAAFCRLNDKEIAGIVADIPWEWLPLIQERQALTEHIIRRRELAPEICGRLCALIPNVNRRSNDD
jgi:hypothetical protein